MQYRFSFQEHDCCAYFHDEYVAYLKAMLWDEMTNEAANYVTDYAESERFPSRRGLQMQNLAYTAALSHMIDQLREAIVDVVPNHSGAALELCNQILADWRSSLLPAFTTKLEQLRELRPKSVAMYEMV